MLRSCCVIHFVLFVLVFAVCCSLVSCQSANWKDSTATQITSDLAHNAPNIAAFNNQLWMAFVGSQYGIWTVSSSDNGLTWAGANLIRSMDQYEGGVGLITFNNKLTVVLAGLTYGICSATSTDGTNWSDCPFNQFNSYAFNGAAGLAVFNNQLYMAMAASKPLALCISSSSDAVTWTACNWQTTVQYSVPKLYVVNNVLYLTWNATNQFLLSTSTTGTSWSASVPFGPSSASLSVTGSAPALAFSNNLWHMCLRGVQNELFYSWSADAGQSWTIPTQILTSMQTTDSPSLLSFQGKLNLAFIGPQQQIYFTSTILTTSSQSSAAVCQPCVWLLLLPMIFWIVAL